MQYNQCILKTVVVRELSLAGLQTTPGLGEMILHPPQHTGVGYSTMHAPDVAHVPSPRTPLQYAASL